MIRRTLVAVLFATCVLSANADERFTIERIEIRNAQRVAPTLLAAETMLREGSEVSEDDVRAGVRRLTRLPFVFTADYALEQGSDSARRVVIISVRENNRFWFLVDGRFALVHNPIDALDYDFPDPTADWKHAAGGVRWLFGDGGLAHFGQTVLRNRHPFRKNYAAWELGYTRHRILSTPVFATVIVRSPVDSLEEKTFTPEIVVGMPLTANQTVRVEFEDTSFVKGTIRIAGNPFRDLHAERTVSASWTFDTTNEPYMPMRGTFVKVEPFVWMGEQTSFTNRPGQSFTTVARHSTATGLDLAAERHWQLSDTSSVSAGLLAGWARVHTRQNPKDRPDLRWQPSFEVIQGGYARRIWRSHVELKGGVVLRQASGDAPGSGLTETSYEVSASWMRRYTIGALRLGFTYTE